METVFTTLVVALGASWCAGINLYATVFVLGAMSRYTAFELPGDLTVLESHWVMWPALAMYTVEFFADKVPAVDSAWDAIHSFIRIPAGVALAATALGEVPLEAQVLAGLVGGGLAATSHTTKMTARLAAHATGTSPVASPALSLAEDVAVIGTMAFVATHPILALIALVVMMAAAYFVLRVFWKLARRALASVARLFRGPDPELPAPA